MGVSTLTCGQGPRRAVEFIYLLSKYILNKLVCARHRSAMDNKHSMVPMELTICGGTNTFCLYDYSLTIMNCDQSYGAMTIDN